VGASPVRARGAPRRPRRWRRDRLDGSRRRIPVGARRRGRRPRARHRVAPARVVRVARGAPRLYPARAADGRRIAGGRVLRAARLAGRGDVHRVARRRRVRPDAPRPRLSERRRAGDARIWNGAGGRCIWTGVTAPPEPGGPSAFSGDPFPSPALASGGAPWPVAVPARDDVDLDGLAECVPDSASRARDAGSFAQVFDEHYVGLVRLALAHCGDRALAEDAVAEAYARVWPRFSRGTVADVDAYLRRAVLNEIRGRFRRR